MFTLLVKLAENAPEWLRDYYRGWTATHAGDSGVDTPNSFDVSVPMDGSAATVMLGVSCAMRNNETGELVSYYLYPRSSISKTPLIMANSVGVIDAGYRGELMAKVKYIGRERDDGASAAYVVKEQVRLFQVCASDLSPLAVELVDTLEESTRGSGGFGSTGTHATKQQCESREAASRSCSQ